MREQANLVLELGSEELPARYVDIALSYFERELPKILKEVDLSFKEVRCDGTPRRLMIEIKNLQTRQEDREFEVLGPPANAAFDAAGNLTQAGAGFLKARGAAPESAYKKESKRGEVLAAKVFEHGKQSVDILGESFAGLVRKIPFPKTMRWDDSGFRYARPLRWILAMHGEALIPMRLGSVESGTLTYGHRFLSGEALKVSSADAYLSSIRKAHVMLGRRERQNAIVDAANELVKEVSGRMVVNQDLLEEVGNLIEKPFVLRGSFDTSFLDMPKELLLSEMNGHQRYFGVEADDGRLLPYFIVVSASPMQDSAGASAGFARVLRARFADGAFYYQHDLDTGLEAMASKLEHVAFHRKLGSVQNKAKRCAIIAGALSERLELGFSKDAIAETTTLFKADLNAGVIGEFPELQGLMGAHYALKQGVDPMIASAIESHYQPKGAHDPVAKDSLGALVGVADRLDSLVGLLQFEKLPKGNRDPLGLRRIAISMLRVCRKHGWDISLDALLEYAAEGYKYTHPDMEIDVAIVRTFLVNRAVGVLSSELEAEQGKTPPKSLIDGVLERGDDRFLDAYKRALAVESLREDSNETFLTLVGLCKRVDNILTKSKDVEKNDIVDSALLVEDAEKNLSRHVYQIINEAKSMNYRDRFVALAGIVPHVSRFFDDVMVNADDPKLRANRLGLLATLQGLWRDLLDFSVVADLN